MACEYVNFKVLSISVEGRQHLEGVVAAWEGSADEQASVNYRIRVLKVLRLFQEKYHAFRV